MSTTESYRYEIRYANGQRETFVTRRDWGKVQDARRAAPGVGPWRVVSVRKVAR